MLVARSPSVRLSKRVTIMKRSDFFDSPRLWSRRKHRLLGKYIQPFSAKVGSRAGDRRVYCIDGFAGKAKYGDNSPGSPLMLAHQADITARWARPVDLRLINVEADPENYASLRYLTEQWEQRGVVINKRGEFASLITEIISEIGDAPALFFIDPYGPTAIPFSCLRPILNRPQQKTELIINFDHDGLRRLTDQLHSRAQTPSAIRGAQTTIMRAVEIVGSDQWKTIFETTSLSAEEREMVLIQEYMSNLSKFGFKVVAYPIREFINTPIKYYLVHCTRHPDAIELMNDFICEEEDEILKDSTSDPMQPALFDAVQQARSRRHQELKGLILAYAEETRTTTRGQIKRHFIHQHIGVYHQKEYNAVVKELIAEGTLRGRRIRINDEDSLSFMPRQEGLLLC
jgi:three-Cys-motif partner protein